MKQRVKLARCRCRPSHLAPIDCPSYTAQVRERIFYAVVDFRTLAREAGESEPSTSPALRAANRLAEILG